MSVSGVSGVHPRLLDSRFGQAAGSQLSRVSAIPGAGPARSVNVDIYIQYLPSIQYSTSTVQHSAVSVVPRECDVADAVQMGSGLY